MVEKRTPDIFIFCPAKRAICPNGDLCVERDGRPVLSCTAMLRLLLRDIDTYDTTDDLQSYLAFEAAIRQLSPIELTQYAKRLNDALKDSEPPRGFAKNITRFPGQGNS